jgi:signal transduction histidine kinase
MRLPCRSLAIRYGTAVIATGVVLGLRLVLIPLKPATQDAPFLMFFLAVLIAAIRGGFGPGLLATVLAAGCNDYFFMKPLGTFELTAEQVLQLAMFIVEGVLISFICARLRASRRAIEDGAAEARALERRILEISDAEQRRIGHDLHDGLGQHLTGIALLMRRLQKHLIARGAPEAADAEKVANLANTAVGWTHDLCRSLSPAALESAGLAEGLRELAANAENIFSIACVFEADNEERAATIDVESAGNLYRIAQEAISNAVRHGKATRVDLRLIGRPTAVEIEISDNGTGVAAHQPASPDGNGMGLRIMRYRAKMIGADVTVRPRNGGGTVVACRYPLPTATWDANP